MPSTLATTLVILIALVPGALGSYLFDAINGLDWREKDWGAGVRYVAFSAFGLALYVLVAGWCHWLPAAHVMPATYLDDALRPEDLGRVALPFVGHLVGGGIAGLVAALGGRAVSALTGGSPHPGAWDDFVSDSTQDRWVVVTLKSGDVFAGFLSVADVGVPPTDRDIVLREPAQYDPVKQVYSVTTYWDMYIPAALLQNIGAVALDTDARIGPKPGQSLW